MQHFVYLQILCYQLEKNIWVTSIISRHFYIRNKLLGYPRGQSPSKICFSCKANWYTCTFREATPSFSLLPPYNLGSFHKGNNLLPSEQILSFKKCPYLVRLRSTSKQTGSHKYCLSMKTWRKICRCIHTP